MISALTLCCIATVANFYSIDEPYLYGILKQEVGTVGKETVNKNGSHDIGPFQINTQWVPTFTKYWKMPSDAATREMLRDNGCANAAAAGAIFYTYRLEAGGNNDLAAIYYHSHSASEGAKYWSRVGPNIRSFSQELRAKTQKTFCSK